MMWPPEDSRIEAMFLRAALTPWTATLILASSRAWLADVLACLALDFVAGFFLAAGAAWATSPPNSSGFVGPGTSHRPSRRPANRASPPCELMRRRIRASFGLPNAIRAGGRRRPGFRLFSHRQAKTQGLFTAPARQRRARPVLA